ncbi:MAG TPA: PKD domain-containing protein, partial [Bacteroidales bacterium]|nr:PKD domain-containing protein [Bacteroidales bacterium]
SVDNTMPVVGETVVFTDASSGTGLYSWSWNFGANATPATSTSQGPVSVSYSAAGYKTVSLNVTDIFGSDNETKTNYINVGTPPTAGAIGSNQTICSGSTPAALTSTTNGTGSGTLSYEWQTNASSSWVTISGATSAGYQPPALTATTSYQRRTVTVYGGKTRYSAYTTAVTITVNPLPTITTSGIISSLCYNAGSQTSSLAYSATTNSPTSYSIDWISGPVDQGSTSFSFGSGGGTINNISISAGVAAGSYSGTMTIRNNNGCTNTQAVSITIVPTSLTWDGSSSNNWHTADNWTPAYVPLSCTDVTIPYTGISNFPTISSAATCNNINIASGASLLDNGNLTVSGTATVGRTIATDWYWHFLSSPVSAQPVWNQFSPTPTGSPLTFGASPWYWDFYYYNPNCPSSGLYWVNLRKVNGEYNNSTIDQGDSYAGFGAATPNMQVGRGYLVAYGPSYGSTSHTFSGTLNTGTVNISKSNTADVYNLVGNPYPSSIDWKAASGWTRTDLATSGGGYNYWIWNDAGTGNYGLYNSAETDDVGTNSTSRYIAPTQGFFVEAANLGTFTMSMDNNVRVHSTQTWLKNGTTTPGSLRLKLTTSANTYSDEMIVSFNPAFSGTEGSDKFWSWYTEAPELYSYKNNNYYSIDRYAGVTEGLTVNVYAKTGVAGTYTLTSPNVSQFALAQTVILKNVNTGVETNLRENNTVTFTATGYGYVPFQLIFLDPVLNKTSVKDGSWYAADTWSPAGVPVATDDVIIHHNVTIDNSPAAICKSLTIDAPGVLTVATGKELTVNETISNNAGAASFVIESGASLLNNTSGVAGTVKRFINKDTWHLASSPVEGETIGDAFPTARKVSRFNEPTRRWVQLPAATVMGAATGYQVDLRASATCTFAGNLNAGDVVKSGLTNSGSGATYNGWNCIGNPY